MVPVDSSMMDWVEYDRRNLRLIINFRHGGLYMYHDVPPEVGDGLIASESPGRYFLRTIRDRYRFVR